ncbi:MAG: 4-hydroxy-3-methylbut-2-enyl diphosphate reductase, partial [Candidatus Gastranaerophilales bacterium]|nr:4-hydroxy-3-methylbut-2-enyl diphosphate reductase [Candidatus Gastranaerophilales bacterium]
TVKLAKNAGFCYGVKRAVDTTKKLKQENPSKAVSVLGELIHNSHVTSELEMLGIQTLTTLPQKGEGICIIRSHGESDKVFEEVKEKGYELVDLTCLDVKKVQSKAVEMVLDGYFVIILGKYDHPEVSAIYANAKSKAKDINDVFVAQNVDALKAIEAKIKSAKKVGVVLQTTQTKEYLFEVVNYLSQICKVLKVQNTICPSTTLRQEEAKKLGKESDLMVVVGSKKSANTTHLAQILESITKTIHIEHQDELENYKKEIEQAQNIGVTAGASTPDSIIQAVIKTIENIN